MRKSIKKIIVLLIALLAAFIYYYISLPAINFHSKDLWSFILFGLFIIIVIYIVKSLKTSGKLELKKEYLDFKDMYYRLKFLKPLLLLFGILLGAVIIGSILSSPFVNAKKYQQLLTVEDRNFQEDILQANYSQIPLLDSSSAALLGNREMGSLVELASQFEVSNNYAQINYKDKPVRVTALKYASFIKWLTNQKQGIPGYIMIDMTTQDATLVNVPEGIKYSESEYFNRNLYRHLRFNYPTYIFGDQLFFEISDDGVPYWVCPVKKFNIGLFGGETVGKAILCNAITGECTSYDVKDVPMWVDKVFSAELLISLYDYSGTLKHGYWNSILSQKDCLQSTNGYNYIALEDDVWVYTGVTSVSADQSNVGFVLMNQRTMETRFYRVEGAIEDSAMSSAQGQVQHLGYIATFPLLLNIENEPTYFLALKDEAGLVKKYAMVNVQKYQLVAIGDTVKECEKEYRQLLSVNGIDSGANGVIEEKTGIINTIVPIVLEGYTHYYFTIRGDKTIFDINMEDDSFTSIINYKEGSSIRFMVFPTREAVLVPVEQLK